MKIQFIEEAPLHGTAVIGVFSEKGLPTPAAALDRACQGLLSQVLSSFDAKVGSMVRLILPIPSPLKEIHILGLGSCEEELTLHKIQEIGGMLMRDLEKLGEKNITIALPHHNNSPLAHDEMNAHCAFGALLRSWELTKYKTKTKDEKCSEHLETLTLMTPSPADAEKHFAPLQALAEGIFLCRELVTEPSNVLYPETFVERTAFLQKFGVSLEILDERDMERLGMNTILSVGKGSVHPPRLLILWWNGGAQDEPPLALVGKGVTFDTGGICLKTSPGMQEMKSDMAGAAAIVGTIATLAKRKAATNVIGVLGLAENMPSGTALKPSDVITSLSGQTIEIIDTDAEGRLVLADALWYAQERFKPKMIIDLATLTGAAIIALGHEYGALFSNDEALADNLLKASRVTGENLWRLPLCEAYEKDLSSDIADIKNLGTSRVAGCCTAAQFLQHFVNQVPWAHLDIAGVALSKKSKALYKKGATAFGVRLLEEFIRNHFEKL